MNSVLTRKQFKNNKSEWIPIAEYREEFGMVDVFSKNFSVQRCVDSKRIGKNLMGDDVWMNKEFYFINPTHFMHIPKGPTQ